MSMSPTAAAESESATEPTTQSQPAITFIDPSKRNEFDKRFRAATGANTPLPTTSDALLLRDSLGNVLGAAYIHVRHLMSPYVLLDEAPADSLSRLANAITDQLRATVRESLLALHESPPAADTDFGLSYDVYVPVGSEPPADFERLAVEVWRKRVC